MRISSGRLALTAVFAALSAFASLAYADSDSQYNAFEDDVHGCYDRHANQKNDESIQLGPRPYYLVDNMDEGQPAQGEARVSAPRDRLSRRTSRSATAAPRRCSSRSTPRSAYEAGARMGAGILECDVTFTKDRRARLPPRPV